MAATQRIGFTQEQNQLSIIFKALGHPARLAILDLLIEQEQIMYKEITFHVKLSAPTISRHVHVLLQSGLIGYEKIANATFYTINPLMIDLAKSVLSDMKDKSIDKEIDYSRTSFFNTGYKEGF